MAILKMKKVRELDAAGRRSQMKELRLELAKERAAAEIGGTVKSPGRMREIRRAIARLLTAESEKR